MMRWTEGGDDSPAARRAADLLRKLPAPTALTARQLTNLEARLQAPAPRRARLLPWTLALGATAFAAIIIILVSRRSPPRQPPSALRTIVLPQCGDVALDLPGVTLTGPGTATVEADHIILAAGRLHVAASPRTLTISAPDGQITMSPGSAADIHVRDARTIIAALDGSIAVQWTSSRTLTQLSPGTSVSDTGPATLPPAHCAAPAAPPSPSPSQSPSPSAAPAGVGPSPTVAPGPLPSPTLAAPARRTPSAPARAPGPVAGAVAVPAPAPSAPSAPTAPSAPPAPAPATAAAPAAAAESPLGAEARLLSIALLRLRAHDAAGAHSILDDYDARFPRGQLAVEASRLRAAVRSLPAPSPRDD